MLTVCYVLLFCVFCAFLVFVSVWAMLSWCLKISIVCNICLKICSSYNMKPFSNQNKLSYVSLKYRTPLKLHVILTVNVESNYVPLGKWAYLALKVNLRYNNVNAIMQNCSDYIHHCLSKCVCFKLSLKNIKKKLGSI